MSAAAVSAPAGKVIELLYPAAPAPIATEVLFEPELEELTVPPEFVAVRVELAPTQMGFGAATKETDGKGLIITTTGSIIEHPLAKEDSI